MRVVFLAFIGVMLATGFATPAELEAQWVPPNRFPLPDSIADRPAGPGQFPDRGGLETDRDRQPMPSTPAPASRYEGDRFGRYVVTGGAIGMLTGILVGATAAITCSSSCSYFPGGEIFIGMIGGTGTGAIVGLIAYAIATRSQP